MIAYQASKNQIRFICFFCTLVVFTLFLCPSLSLAKTNSQQQESSYVAGEVLVKFKDGTKDSDIADIKKRHGLTDVDPVREKGVHHHRVKISEGTTVEKAVEKLKQDPSVEYAEPNYLIQLFSNGIGSDERTKFEGKYGAISVEDRHGLRRLKVSDPKAQNGSPKDIADRVMSDGMSIMDIDPTEHKISAVQESISGHHVRYQQTYHGIPIYGTETSVHLDKLGGVRLIQHAGQTIKAAPTEATLSSEDATASAGKDLNAVGNSSLLDTPLLMIYVDNNGAAHLVWRVRLMTSSPMGSWESLVDATDGTVLMKRNRMAQMSGTGNVFDPNPTRRAAAMGYPAPTHGSDIYNVPPPTNATDLTPFMESRTFSELDGTGYLQSAAIKIINSKYGSGLNHSVAYSTTGNFAFPYNDSLGRFEEVMGYYHLQKFHTRLMNDLGYSATGLLQNVQVIADVHEGGFSTATGAPDHIVFGDFHWPATATELRKRSVAQDADALIHEYGGHIVYWNIHPDIMYLNPGMEEGWADFAAASYFDDPIIGEWADEVNGAGYRRNLNNTLTLADWSIDSHFNAQIWGGALWKIREKLMNQFVGGSTTRANVASLMDTLVLEGIYLFTQPTYTLKNVEEPVLQGRESFLMALEMLTALPASDPRYDSRYAEINKNMVQKEFAKVLTPVLPNDPYFDTAWTLYCSGTYTIRDATLTSPPNGNPIGTANCLTDSAGADINAPEAWAITTGRSDVIAAIIDSGVNLTHSDLNDNIWINVGELPADFVSQGDADGDGVLTFKDLNMGTVIENNVLVKHVGQYSVHDENGNGRIDGQDLLKAIQKGYIPSDVNGDGKPDDDNGYTDDVIGWNFTYDSNDPSYAAGMHGTMVAGVVGAVGNNGIGSTGVNWKVSLMALSGATYADQATAAIAYAVDKKANVINVSWGLYPNVFSQSVYDAAKNAAAHDILFVAAAGNTAQLGWSDLDNNELYPQKNPLPNMIIVTATDSNNNQSEIFGKYTVDLAAPTGLYEPNFIVSGKDDYDYLAQTSGATPHVTGAIALLLAAEKDRIDANSTYRKMTMGEIKYLLLTSVDPLPSLKGKCVSEGKLNVYKLLLNYQDSDMDGYADKIEALFGTDPNDPASHPDMDADDDNDGLSNGLELAYGTIPVPADKLTGDLRGKIYPIWLDSNGHLLPGITSQDSDGDGLSDFDEVTGKISGYVTDPANPDTNGNGINDKNDPAPSQVHAVYRDLAITMTDSPDPVSSDKNLTYAITVTNKSSQGATGVTLTDQLPSSVHFVSVSSSQGKCASEQKIVCDLGSLAQSARATVTIVVKPTAGGVLLNTATVTSIEVDQHPSDNMVSVQTMVMLQCNDNNVCTTDTYDPVNKGCVFSPIPGCTTGNNFTITAYDYNGIPFGGTNDIVFTWDGTRKTAVVASGQISNATLFSSAPCNVIGSKWSAHDVAIYAPGTYTVYTGCAAGSPGCGSGAPITFTVAAGEVGVHLLWDWNTSLDMDVVNVWAPKAKYAPSSLWTGGCGSNPADKVWDWMSKDGNNDGINGFPMIDGSFAGWIANFNVMGIPPDICADSATRCDDNDVCTTDTCDTASGGCIHTPTAVCINTTGNNFTFLGSNGMVGGGTNDVKFTWDGTIQDATTFNNGTGPSNASLSSDEPYSNWLWIAKHVQIVGSGTYWVDLDGAGPGANRFEVTIPTGQLGVHMLMDWGSNIGQTTSCGKTDCDVDVWMAWASNGAFAAGKVWTGADDGTLSNGPGWDDPYPLLFNIDGRPNAGAKVWDLVSVDLAGRITSSLSTTITNLPKDNVPGIKMREGAFTNSSVNFNLMKTDKCVDSATRCNDNNLCTKDTCNPATGACTHTPIVCNDANACTTDTCDPAIGCVFSAPKSCNDNNACTLDWCDPVKGTCLHAGIFCNDNNICTTDSCNPAIGCVYTPNTNACSDNNACTVGDHCSGGVCVSGTPKVCSNNSVCSTATGCPVTSPVSTSGNNMTVLLPNGYIMGGANNVTFTWDGTLQDATTFYKGVSNATISSDEPLYGWPWVARNVQVVSAGTYSVYFHAAGQTTSRYEVTIPTGRIGAHMLFDWGEDQPDTTTCGKTDCDVDVWIAWDFNNAFATGELFTGGNGSPNTGATVWGLVSVDLSGRITNAKGGTLKELRLDQVPGIQMMDGYINACINFNMRLEPPCSDAATRCNDNDSCTTDTCDSATGACVHTAVCGWNDVTGEGSYNESCIAWLTRTNQAGIKRRGINVTTGYADEGDCAYALTDGTCVPTAGETAKTSTWKPVASCVQNGNTYKTQYAR